MREELIVTVSVRRKTGDTSVYLFDDYELHYNDKYEIYSGSNELGKMVYEKIEKVEELNEQAGMPF